MSPFFRIGIHSDVFPVQLMSRLIPIEDVGEQDVIATTIVTSEEVRVRCIFDPIG
jgi:hypothetical protein